MQGKIRDLIIGIPLIANQKRQERFERDGWVIRVRKQYTVHVLEIMRCRTDRTRK